MIIFVDPTTNEIKIELWEKDKCISQVSFTDDRKLSDKLLPNVEDLLKKASFTIKDLEGIAVINGPGSFTGLRIALSTFNALAYSLNIPILGVKNGSFDPKIFSQLAKEGHFSEPIMPIYSAKPKTTKPKVRG